MSPPAYRNQQSLDIDLGFPLMNLDADGLREEQLADRDETSDYSDDELIESRKHAIKSHPDYSLVKDGTSCCTLHLLVS
ncbi:MAG: hypothetical protein QOF38_5131 [Pseudonocardiales bacterium]|jgi:hypothetical protein|nr:hypothetical protein [Pseudonocardiales bacterium]MDT7753975.1 hypothetical protein [Pseudonocardiales bacterium]